MDIIHHTLTFKKMNIKEVAKLMNTLAEVYPDCEVTFANNKVPVNTLSYDAKSNSINLR